MVAHRALQRCGAPIHCQGCCGVMAHLTAVMDLLSLFQLKLVIQIPIRYR